ncbi:hypothetical protein B0H10DRAFT_2183324 [Mycena sp. CBHHK59/15]|nr:hypothetical protein B0H10DRAFT_2183324 [Mycena sp. CBHHK59/15]
MNSGGKHPSLTDLGQNVLLKICAEIFEGRYASRTGRVILVRRDSNGEREPPRIFPAAPSQTLLYLAPMHSELSKATRPYIWSEVLVAFGSYDPTERGADRLERAKQPHLAPHPPMYPDVAAAIREHPGVDTLVVWHMAQCADLIAKGSPKEYKIELEYCHGKSAGILSRPAGIKFLRLQNMEPQDLAKNMPADIWDTLEHLEPGYPDMGQTNHPHMQASLKVGPRANHTYLDNGGAPVLRSLDLSYMSMYAPGRKGWLALGKRLPALRSFTYAPGLDASLAEVKAFLKAFHGVSRLHITVPSSGEYDPDEEDIDEIELDSDFLDLLAKLPNLERLILDVRTPVHLLDEDLEAMGETMVEALIELRYIWDDMDCEDVPVVVEYDITDEGEVVITPPRPLEGTILEFLDWR